MILLIGYVAMVMERARGDCERGRHCDGVGSSAQQLADEVLYANIGPKGDEGHDQEQATWVVLCGPTVDKVQQHDDGARQTT